VKAVGHSSKKVGAYLSASKKAAVKKTRPRKAKKAKAKKAKKTRYA
jgi:hypothetical protein